ncbi:hypothetical protein PYCCODRAFT_1423348 [Trametes coccinea BRFM310]|uniref:GON domain-containing protein n=1 Tax=Trametes coccinea (strain BRFM310) TaxID=1353009 RepID=A0A1Y2IVX6_TRAC3|nr:hypothetical protein PYCCODRAFT_1423348 [Trametes coccinea BRFM310]
MDIIFSAQLASTSSNTTISHGASQQSTARLAELSEYVKTTKPDRALLPHEGLGEDRIRRFSDFPKVSFWTEHKWHVWLNGGGGSAQVGMPAGLLGKATKETSRRRRFLEDINGLPLESSYVHRMRDFCRAFAKMMEQRAYAPPTWREVDLHVAELFYDAIRKKFPEVQLCEGNWKADNLMSQVYYDWKRPSRATKRPRDANENDSKQQQVSLFEAKYSIPPSDTAPMPGPSLAKKARKNSPMPLQDVKSLDAGARADKGKGVAKNPLLIQDDLHHAIASPQASSVLPAASGVTSTGSAGVGQAQAQIEKREGDDAGASDKVPTAQPRNDERSAPPAVGTASVDIAEPIAGEGRVTVDPPEVSKSVAGVQVPTHQRKDSREKPWPPPEDTIQPKWVYARHWAAENPSSTRQTFEDHYKKLSPAERKYAHKVSKSTSMYGSADRSMMVQKCEQTLRSHVVREDAGYNLAFGFRNAAASCPSSGQNSPRE